MARPRLIDQQQIVTAALQVLDDVGPERFSLATVASRLGVTTPALYNHFNERSAILEEAARQVFGPPDVPRSAGYPPEQYEDYIVDRCLASFRQASEHPAAALLLLSHVPPELVEAGFADMTTLMSAAGVSETERLVIFEGVQKLIWGWMLILNVLDRSTPQRVSALTGLPAAETLERCVRALVRGVRCRAHESSD